MLVNNENKFKDKFLLKKIGSISGTYNNVSLVGMIVKMRNDDLFMIVYTTITKEFLRK